MKKRLMSMMVFLLMFTMVGCQDKVMEEASERVESTETIVSEIADSDAYYPVTIKNYNRSKEEIEITFDKRPEKVVAVYQNSIETLLALGVEDLMIAATGLDHEIKPEFQEAFKSVAYYDDGISKEEVMGLNPDFILSWSSFFGDKKLGDVDFWQDRGINTYMMINSGAIDGDRSLENEYQDIKNLGIIFNAQDKADEIIDSIKDQIEKGKEFAKGKEAVRAIVLESNSDGTFRVYGENSVGGDMASQVGADLVAKESGIIGAEDLVALNPEVIFTVYYSYFGGSVEEEEAMSSILENEGLASIAAVQNNRVLPMKLGEVYCSGIRTLDGVETMLKGLYPNDVQEE